MAVRILYFAGLRESLGLAEESLVLPAEVATLGQLRDWLAGAGGRASLATARNVRYALNQQMAGADTLLADGDEIAFFPPVTGG